MRIYIFENAASDESSEGFQCQKNIFPIFQNVIPSACCVLRWDKANVKQATSVNFKFNTSVSVYAALEVFEFNSIL